VGDSLKEHKKRISTLNTVILELYRTRGIVERKKENHFDE
jgi:hypothetical protein